MKCYFSAYLCVQSHNSNVIGTNYFEIIIGFVFDIWSI